MYIYIYEESRATYLYIYIPGVVLWVLTNWMGHMMSPACGVYSFVIGSKFLRLTTNFCTGQGRGKIQGRCEDRKNFLNLKFWLKRDKVRE